MIGQPRYLDRRTQDLALLAAGQDTGWWDHTGQPAPWPEDFWLADGTINPHWRPDAGSRKEDDATDDQAF